MLRDYEAEVSNVLNDVYETCFCRIEERKLYRWYDAKRLTDKIWKDLSTRFTEIDQARDAEGYRLGFVNWHTPGFITLMCIDPGFEPDEKLSYQLIEAKCGRE